MKITKCPVCENQTFKKQFSLKLKTSSFVKCDKCNLIFQNPQEDVNITIGRYGEDYFKYELDNQYNFFDLIKKTLHDHKILKLLPANAKVLEIGSATGLFLKYMDSLGYKSTGLEVCKESVEYGIKKYGVDLINKRLEDVVLENDSFDLIHFSHLIEHLNDPVYFLSRVKELLKKGGCVLLTTPNASGLFAKIYSDSWRCVVDDHLFLFNINNLKILLERSGFKIVKKITWGSIPAGRSNKLVKSMFDKIVKMFYLGDVVSYLVQKD